MEHLIPMCVMCAKHEIGTFNGSTDATCSAACEAALIKQVQEINRKLDAFQRKGNQRANKYAKDESDTYAVRA